MKSARIALVALLALSSQLVAQSKPQTREGFTIAFGVGSGSIGASCDFCSTSRQSDATGFLRIGGTLHPNLIIAGEARGWTHEIDETTTATVGFLLADLLYYPQPQHGWYLEGGLGVGQYKNSDDQSGNDFTSTGLALSIGTGYDFRVAKTFSLTPFLSWSGTGGAKVKQNGMSTGAKFDVNLFQIGLGFTWH
jgi:hypothetical protein